MACEMFWKASFFSVPSCPSQRGAHGLEPRTPERTHNFAICLFLSTFYLQPCAAFAFIQLSTIIKPKYKNNRKKKRKRSEPSGKKRIIQHTIIIILPRVIVMMTWANENCLFCSISASASTDMCSKFQPFDVRHGLVVDSILCLSNMCFIHISYHLFVTCVHPSLTAILLCRIPL